MDKVDRILPDWAKRLEDIEDQFLKLLGSHLFTKQTVRDLIWGHEIDALKDIKDILKFLGFENYKMNEAEAHVAGNRTN